VDNKKGDRGIKEHVKECQILARIVPTNWRSETDRRAPAFRKKRGPEVLDQERSEGAAWEEIRETEEVRQVRKNQRGEKLTDPNGGL